MPEKLLNGGHTALYAWGQTLEEVTIRLPVLDRCNVQKPTSSFFPK